MSADPDLDEAIQRGRIQPGDRVRDYLKAIHIGTSGIIAVFFKDHASVRNLVNRLKTGITVAGTEYKLTADVVEDAVLAQWVVVTNVLRNKYTVHHGNDPCRPASSSAPPTATPTASLLPRQTKIRFLRLCQRTSTRSQSAITMRSSWTERTAPSRRRCSWELTKRWPGSTTNITSPTTTQRLHMSDIMSQRTFTALGTINANRKKDNVDKQLIIDCKNNISTKDPADWDVRGSMMIPDAIDSICWAWIPPKYGTEKRIHRYCEWFKGLTRKDTQRLPQIRTLLEAF